MFRTIEESSAYWSKHRARVSGALNLASFRAEKAEVPRSNGTLNLVLYSISDQSEQLLDVEKS